MLPALSPAMSTGPCRRGEGEKHIAFLLGGAELLLYAQAMDALALHDLSSESMQLRLFWKKLVLLEGTHGVPSRGLIELECFLMPNA